jgi:hypothetical protein
MKKHVYPSLDAIQAMNRTELIEAFKDAQIGCIPKNASQKFLRGNLAWSAQAAAQGHDPVSLRQTLAKKVTKATPGTRLIREWQGVTHEVTIEEKGYSWNGECYRNLSHIAREITGTRWSGPRFFGLNGEKR